MLFMVPVPNLADFSPNLEHVRAICNEFARSLNCLSSPFQAVLTPLVTHLHFCYKRKQHPSRTIPPTMNTSFLLLLVATLLVAAFANPLERVKRGGFKLYYKLTTRLSKGTSA